MSSRNRSEWCAGGESGVGRRRVEGACPSTGRDMASQYVKWLVYMWHVSFIFGLDWSTDAELKTLVQASWRDSSICDVTFWYVTWLIHIWHGASGDAELKVWSQHRSWHDSSVCEMTSSCVTWRIHIWLGASGDAELKALVPAQVAIFWMDSWKDSFICDMIHYYVTWSIHVWHDWLISDKIYPWMNLVTYEWVMTWMILVIFIGKVVFICLGVLVNLVSKFQGKPGTITVKHEFNPNGLKFHRGSPWVSILSWLYLKANKDYFSYEHMNNHMNE